MTAWTNLLRLEDRVLDTIYQHPGSTRSSLVDTLGVSRSALGRALDGLIATGAVVPGPRSQHSGPGRPVTYLSVAGDRGFSLGIDVGRTRCVALVRDRRGAVLVRARAHVETFSHWRDPLRHVVHKLVEEADFKQVDLSGVQCTGVGLPVPVLEDFDVTVVEDLLGEVHAGLIHVRNNVFVEALAQTAGSAPSLCHMFVRISGGIGSCLVMSTPPREAVSEHVTTAPARPPHVVVRAADVRHFRLLAGELGHIPVSVSTQVCHCGRTGCAETVASVTAICHSAGVDDLEELRLAYDAGQSAARDAIGSAARALTEVFTAAALSARLDAIVLGGALVEAVPDLMVQIHQQLPAQFPPSIGFVPRLVSANPDPVMGALGAALAAETRLQDQRLNEAEGTWSLSTSTSGHARP